MHVVDMGNLPNPGQGRPKKSRFLVAKNQIVGIFYEQKKSLDEQQEIQRDFGPRGTDFNFFDKKESGDAQDSQVLDLPVLAQMVGDQINVVSKVRESFYPEKNADGCSAGLEKRLGSEHQNVHAQIRLFKPFPSRSR